MIKINKDKITHIKVFEEREGILSRCGGWRILKYKTEKKTLFSKRGKGFYEECDYCPAYRSLEDVEDNSYRWFVKGESLWTYPRIEIYVGEVLLKTAYFDSLFELERHLEENYKEINFVNYEKIW